MEKESFPEDMDSGNEQRLGAIAEQNFSAWSRALAAGNPGNVAELYAAGATFLPTVSEELKEGQDGAEAYFRHFLEKRPAGEVVDERVQPISPDSYVHSGMYNFAVGPEHDRKVVEARFTFVWQKDGDDEKWRIVHHHSSVKPKGEAERKAA